MANIYYKNARRLERETEPERFLSGRSERDYSDYNRRDAYRAMESDVVSRYSKYGKEW